MDDNERKKLVITMERLQDLYNLAKKHPFRVSRMGRIDDYYDVLDELGEVFYAMVKKSFENSIFLIRGFQRADGYGRTNIGRAFSVSEENVTHRPQNIWKHMNII